MAVLSNKYLGEFIDQQFHRMLEEFKNDHLLTNNKKKYELIIIKNYLYTLHIIQV
jgi:hypothetical protein